MPQWSVRPLTRTSLSSQPLLLIGTLTAINTKGRRDENADAFRICLVLIDLRTGKLVAKRVDRATLTTVSAEPTPLFRDSPTWALDRTAVAYIKSCQGSSPGDSVDPGVPAAPAGRGDRRRGAGGVRREQAGRGLSPVPRGPAARRRRRPAHPQRPLPHRAGAPARRRRRPRPSAGSSASASTARSCRSRSSSTPGRRRCSPRPTCRRSTRSGCARWRSRSACARPA